MPSPDDILWMQRALELARRAADEGEVPVGAVLVSGDRLLAEGWNHPIGGCDPTLHAEIHALRQAANTEKNYRLPGSTLYVTIEPCTMCLGAIVHARVGRVVFGAPEPKAGVIQSRPELLAAGFLNHRFEWDGGVCEEACAAVLQDFFSRRRALKKALREAGGENLPPVAD